MGRNKLHIMACFGSVCLILLMAVEGMSNFPIHPQIPIQEKKKSSYAPPRPPPPDVPYFD